MYEIPGSVAAQKEKTLKISNKIKAAQKSGKRGAGKRLN